MCVDEENDVRIYDESNGKLAYFTGQRWAQFLMEMHDIDLAVQRAMTLKSTNLKLHIGGNWHVSITQLLLLGIPLIDIRRWYIRDDNTLQPTPVGIALSYSQWFLLKKAIEEIQKKVPHLIAISPCWHESKFDAEKCLECTPSPLIDYSN